MMATCPTCERDWDIDGIELRRNIVVTASGAVSLSAMETTIMAAVIQGVVGLEGLASKIYGGSSEAPLCPENSIHVTLYNLRAKLNPLGYTIENSNPGSPGHTAYALKEWADSHVAFDN